MRCRLSLSSAILVLVALPSPVPARLPVRPLAGALPDCKFCTLPQPTLRQDLASAAMVVVGTLTRATLANPAQDFAGITDFVVKQVLHLRPGVRAEKVLVIPRYIPDANKGKFEVLLFVDVVKGKIDPWKGIRLKANSDMPKYVAGILKLKDKKPADRLRFYFDYLPSAEAEIASDALREFEMADYKDVRAMACRLPAEKLAVWLRKPTLRPSQTGYCAMLLGHCSKDRAKDARLLRSLADTAIKNSNINLDKILIGYILLDPKEGLQFARQILQRESNAFMVRYAALRALRFFKTTRPDVLLRQDILRAIALLLPHADIADIPIEDFRRWKCWELTPHVLALSNSKARDIPVVRRAILRFALCSPCPEAKEFVAEKRRSDPEVVSDMEKVLKLERAQAPSPK